MLKLRNLNYENYGSFIYDFFQSVKEMYSDRNLEDHYDYNKTPKISLIAVSEASSKDMFGVVTSDYGNIVQFSKEVLNKGGDSVINTYCIPKRMLKYIHFYSKTIISTLHEFFERESLLSADNFSFYRNSEQISYDEMLVSDFYTAYYDKIRINTLEDLLIFFPKCQPLFAYYIPEESYNFIHVFAVSRKNYEVKKEAFEMIDTQAYDQVVKIYTSEILNFDPKMKTMQKLNQEISVIIISGIFPSIF